jgi:hypothetical protein
MDARIDLSIGLKLKSKEEAEEIIRKHKEHKFTTETSITKEEGETPYTEDISIETQKKHELKKIIFDVAVKQDGRVHISITPLIPYEIPDPFEPSKELYFNYPEEKGCEDKIIQELDQRILPLVKDLVNAAEEIKYEEYNFPFKNEKKYINNYLKHFMQYYRVLATKGNEKDKKRFDNKEYLQLMTEHAAGSVYEGISQSGAHEIASILFSIFTLHALKKYGLLKDTDLLIRAGQKIFQHTRYIYKGGDYRGDHELKLTNGKRKYIAWKYDKYILAYNQKILLLAKPRWKEITGKEPTPEEKDFLDWLEKQTFLTTTEVEELENSKVVKRENRELIKDYLN